MKSKKYITPTLTVVAFKAEQGFAVSGGAETMFLDLSIFESKDYNDQAQQKWNEEDGSLFGSWL